MDDDYSDDLEPPVLPYEEYLPVKDITERFVDRLLNYAEKEVEKSEGTQKSTPEVDDDSDDLDLDLFSLTGDLLEDQLTDPNLQVQDNEKSESESAFETEEEQIQPPCHPTDKYAIGVCSCPVCYKRRQDALKAEQEAAQKAAEDAAAAAVEEAERLRRLEAEQDAAKEGVEERESLQSLEFEEAWPKNGSFDNESIIEMIIKISSSWKRHPGWMFCVNYLEHKLDCASDDFIYEVIWSVPTKLHPVPQATASVYFTAHISRISPPSMPIKLTYTFENSCYIHKPERRIVNFQERQLINIIQSKIDIFRRIRF